MSTRKKIEEKIEKSLLKVISDRLLEVEGQVCQPQEPVDLPQTEAVMRMVACGILTVITDVLAPSEDE